VLLVAAMPRCNGETQMGRAGERKPPEGWKSLGLKTF
jgi:hypothetical protein